MSNLIEQLFALDEGRSCDAIILQPKTQGSNGAPHYPAANAIIQRINTAGGWQWALRLLQPMGGRIVAGSGMYGDLNDMARYAERQFGVKSDVREWVGVNYADPDFPPNLLPF